MKRWILPATLLIFVYYALSASCAMAAVTSQEYRNADFDMKHIRTIVVMPIKLPAALQNKQYADIKYRWGELIQMKRGEGGYAILTPDQLLQKHYAAKGIRPKKWGNDQERVRYVNEIAPEYADAMLTMTIINCDSSSYKVPEQMVSGDEYEEIKDWDEKGRITSRKELVTAKTLRPARTIRQSEAACRAELWGMTKGKQILVYSCVASEKKSSEIYGNKLPTQERVAMEVMEYVMKRVPVK